MLLEALRENNTVEFASNQLRKWGKKKLHVPSADMILGNIKKNLTVDEIQNTSKVILAEMLKIAKKFGKFGRRVEIAIDLHDDPYYGKNADDPYVVRGEAKNGTTYFHRIATVSIVMFGVRFKIAVLPITKEDNKKLDAVVEYLINEVRKHFKIRYVLLDRGFYQVKVVKKLNRLKVKYIMGARSCEKLMEISKKYGKRSFSITWPLGSEIDVRMVSVYDKKSKARIYYITNMDHEAHLIHKAYDARWGIETGYRVLEEKEIWTTTQSFEVRYFYKIIAIVAYNGWVLGNLILGITIKQYKSGKKTIYKITHKRFIINLAEVVRNLCDYG